MPCGSDKTPLPAIDDQFPNDDDLSAVVDTLLSLDVFFHRYTSKDNENFSKIMEKVNRKRREKYVHLLEGERAKNLLMYNPVDGGEVSLTEEEKAERLKGLTKEIDRSNTQFHGKSIVDSKPTKEEEAVVFLYTPDPDTTPNGASWPFGDRQAEKSKKYVLDDLRKTPNPFFAEYAKKKKREWVYLCEGIVTGSWCGEIAIHDMCRD